MEKPISRPTAFILGCLAGAGLSFLVWVLGAPLGWLALLALAFSFRRLTTTFAAVFGYWMVAGWVCPSLFAHFFHVSTWVGLGVDAAIAVTAAGAALFSTWGVRRLSRQWQSLAWQAWKSALACLVFLVLITIPPLGAFINSSPLLAAASLAPGLGIAGIALTSAFMLTLVWAVTAITGVDTLAPVTGKPNKHTHPALRGAMILAALGWVSIAAHARPVPAGEKSGSVTLLSLAAPHKIKGAGQGPLMEAIYATDIAREARTAIAAHAGQGKSLLMLAPEGALPRYEASSILILAHVAATMPKGMVLAIGAFANSACTADRLSNACVYGLSKSSIDGVVLIGRHRLGLTAARMPAPIGEWKPWAKRSVAAHWFSGPSERITWGDHRHALILVCYEQWLMWPGIRGAMDGHFSVLLAPSSHRWASAGSVERLQHRQAMAQARIYGAKLLYSDASQRR